MRRNVARWISAAASLAILTACGEPAPQHQQVNVDPAASATQRETPPLYAGRWAYEPRLCADGAWAFREDGVSTAGEVSCAFTQIVAAEQRYEIQASCSSEGTTENSRIVLEVDQAAQSMRVSGGPWAAPITLQRCAESAAP